MGNIVGPGGTTGKSGAKTGKSMGPCGPGGSGRDMTTSKGYDSKRTSGLRNEYQVTGKAENSKA